MEHGANKESKADEDDFADVAVPRLVDYKGEFSEDQDTKYQDPVTGAHFKYEDMCRRLRALQKERQQTVQEVEEPGLQIEPNDCGPFDDAYTRFLFKTQEAVVVPQQEQRSRQNTKKAQEEQLQENRNQRSNRLLSLLSATLPEPAKHNRQASCPSGNPTLKHQPIIIGSSKQVHNLLYSPGKEKKEEQKRPKIKIVGMTNKFFSKGGGTCFDSAAFFSSVDGPMCSARPARASVEKEFGSPVKVFESVFSMCKTFENRKTKTGTRKKTLGLPFKICGESPALKKRQTPLFEQQLHIKVKAKLAPEPAKHNNKEQKRKTTGLVVATARGKPLTVHSPSLSLARDTRMRTSISMVNSILSAMSRKNAQNRLSMQPLKAPEKRVPTTTKKKKAAI